MEPHALGILPAAQAAICALSGLASASTALIPREPRLEVYSCPEAGLYIGSFWDDV